MSNSAFISRMDYVNLSWRKQSWNLNDVFFGKLKLLLIFRSPGTASVGGRSSLESSWPAAFFVAIFVLDVAVNVASRAVNYRPERWWRTSEAKERSSNLSSSRYESRLKDTNSLSGQNHH